MTTWHRGTPTHSTLGFRVPMIVISPYARAGYVSHTQYDFGSILKLMEETFNLGSLGTADATAQSMEDVFDFTQAPIAFRREPLPNATALQDAFNRSEADRGDHRKRRRRSGLNG